MLIDAEKSSSVLIETSLETLRLLIFAETKKMPQVEWKYNEKSGKWIIQNLEHAQWAQGNLTISSEFQYKDLDVSW